MSEPNKKPNIAPGNRKKVYPKTAANQRIMYSCINAFKRSANIRIANQGFVTVYCKFLRVKMTIFVTQF